jgi:hypothetical protein
MIMNKIPNFGLFAGTTAVKPHLAFQIRKQSWAFAALFLFAFCGLGFAAVRFGALFKDVDLDLPIGCSFAAHYGPIALPLFGIVAAAGLILSDVLGLKKWVQGVLVAVFTLLLIGAICAMLPGSFDQTGPITGDYVEQ